VKPPRPDPLEAEWRQPLARAEMARLATSGPRHRADLPGPPSVDPLGPPPPPINVAELLEQILAWPPMAADDPQQRESVNTQHEEAP
jgi:hypothetical protein